MYVKTTVMLLQTTDEQKQKLQRPSLIELEISMFVCTVEIGRKGR
jgi:hypothetical protein